MTVPLTVDRLVLTFAATMILVGTVLAAAVNLWFLLVPAFVGLNLLQAQFTQFCPLAKLLVASGCQRGTLF